MKTKDIEIAIARHFGTRKHIIVPNISWGLNIHECDLFLVRPSGYCVEIEIKISIADLKKDATKKHGHEHKLIRELYFAIPEKMLKHIEHIPARAGIFIVKSTEYETPSGEKYINHHAYLYRKAKINVDARTIKDSEVSTLCRLTSIRLWNEKRKHHVNK